MNWFKNIEPVQIILHWFKNKLYLCFVLFCFVSFYWANLPRGKEHEQDSGPMRGAPPYTIQKDQRDRPQHRELRALLFSMSSNNIVLVQKQIVPVKIILYWFKQIVPVQIILYWFKNIEPVQIILYRFKNKLNQS